MNKWIGIGRLTKDVDARYSNNNNEPMCIARYTLAVDRMKKGETDYISCVAFGKQGEFAEKYLKKGTKVAVEGRIQTGSYEKDGRKIYTTDVVVERHEFCESKKTEEQEPPVNSPMEGFLDIPSEGQESLPFK